MGGWMDGTGASIAHPCMAFGCSQVASVPPSCGTYERYSNFGPNTIQLTLSRTHKRNRRSSV
jgi:hypothetical protein